MNEVSRNFYGFILYFDWLKVTSFYKKQKKLRILEPITAFYVNRDGHSEIYITFIFINQGDFTYF